MPDQVRHDGAWERALARLRDTEAELDAAAHTDEALYDRLGDRHDAALKRLLRSPAPDLVALALKLDLTVAEQVWELRDGDLCLAALCEDARRFAATLV